MIPKIIHYCWFGGNPLPPLAKKCIKSWKKYCPDYKIVRWDEHNFDIEQAPLYVRQAYEAKKWAFVTDYIRLKVVYDHGGIYMDTDVELIRNPDELLCNPAFFGFEDKEHVNTGLGFGAEKGAAILNELMSDYWNIPFVLSDGTMDLTACPVRNSSCFLRNGLKPDGTKQVLNGGELVLPIEYFCPIELHTMKLTISENTYSVHHFAGTWLPEETIKRKNYKVRKQQIEKKFGSHMAGIYESFYYALTSNGGDGIYSYVKGILVRRCKRIK